MCLSVWTSTNSKQMNHEAGVYKEEYLLESTSLEGSAGLSKSFVVSSREKRVCQCMFEEEEMPCYQRICTR